MIFNKLTVVALVAFAVLSGEAKIEKIDLAEGGYIELDVEEGRGAGYDQQQAKVLSEFAHKTKDIVTGFLARVTSDKFTNTHVARNGERVALIKKFEELVNEFDSAITEAHLSEDQLDRLSEGLRTIGERLNDFSEVDEAEFAHVKFAIHEFDHQAEIFVKSVFDDLSESQLLASGDVKVNGYNVGDMIVEYSRLLRANGLSDMVDVLRVDLVVLANWLEDKAKSCSDEYLQ